MPTISIEVGTAAEVTEAALTHLAHEVAREFAVDGYEILEVVARDGERAVTYVPNEQPWRPGQSGITTPHGSSIEIAWVTPTVTPGRWRVGYDVTIPGLPSPVSALVAVDADGVDQFGHPRFIRSDRG
jgi:hypothetical protein